ncbi:MAG: hypothetical protein AAGA80_26830 [Cyanobacteria bacterium P01_F01_bin.143]
MKLLHDSYQINKFLHKIYNLRNLMAINWISSHRRTNSRINDRVSIIFTRIAIATIDYSLLSLFGNNIVNKLDLIKVVK